MEYKIKRIDSKDEITQCERFEIDHYQWHCVMTPPAYGYMGYLKGKGLYVLLCCEESDPLRRCENPRDAVCKDSAMEAFLAFTDKGKELTNDDMYLNFEVNSNGAMYAKYGFGRKGRQFISEEVYEEADVQAQIGEKAWQVSLLFPEGFLKEVCGWTAEGCDKDMYCNFYKISEDPEIEHYASYSPIGSETPNFHLPVYFAKAVLEVE